MEKVISWDGTSIVYDRSGVGPALILVAGATATRAAEASVAAALSSDFTVFAYDRRGRGDSGDTAPYGVEREVEDIDALIDAAGGSAFVFGHSSGAVLALEAARLLPAGKIQKLALYEPPFIIDDSRPALPDDYVPHLVDLTRSGRRGEAFAYFMTAAVGAPAEMAAQVLQSPMGPELEKVAHTIAYDGTIMGKTMSGDPATLNKWSSVAVPTLIMDGGASPTSMHIGAQGIARVLPNARRRTFEGQDHGPADDILVPALRAFFLE